MAESKRRSDVKQFTHNTWYPKLSRPLQRNLFWDALIEAGQEWVCQAIGNGAPSVGTTVFVRVLPDTQPDILWGNQIVASILGAPGTELAEAFRNTGQIGGTGATVVSSSDVNSQFAIRLGADQ